MSWNLCCSEPLSCLSLCTVHRILHKTVILQVFHESLEVEFSLFWLHPVLRGDHSHVKECSPFQSNCSSLRFCKNTVQQRQEGRPLHLTAGWFRITRCNCHFQLTLITRHSCIWLSLCILGNHLRRTWSAKGVSSLSVKKWRKKEKKLFHHWLKLFVFLLKKAMTSILSNAESFCTFWRTNSWRD